MRNRRQLAKPSSTARSRALTSMKSSNVIYDEICFGHGSLLSAAQATQYFIRRHTDYFYRFLPGSHTRDDLYISLRNAKGFG
jgi:hypothetical protein